MPAPAPPPRPNASLSWPRATPPPIAAPAPSISIPAPSSRRIEFDAVAADVKRELLALDDRLAGLEPEEDALDDAVSEDVLSEFRKRLEGGLSDAERQEIVQLLVRRITVHTTLPDHGRKQRPRRYRLPLPACSPNSHGHRCESQLQSLPRYRCLSCNSLTTHRVRLQGREPVSPSSSLLISPARSFTEETP